MLKKRILKKPRTKEICEKISVRSCKEVWKISGWK